MMSSDKNLILGSIVVKIVKKQKINTMTELSNPKIYFDFIKACPIVLIHFWAEWNAYDYTMKEKLKEIEIYYSDLICFGSVDVDLEEMHQICKEVKVVNVPALAYFKNNNHIETAIGLGQPIEEKLKLLLEKE